MIDPCLADAVDQFRKYRALAEGALAQVPEEAWFDDPAPECNSVALVMKHMAGNMRSRWTRFLDTDGEKADRDRDSEFERREGDTPATIRARWDQGWRLLFAALEPLGAADLERTVTIRGEPHSVRQAVHRQLTHYAYHAGQIVLIARLRAGASWRSLSIPKGRSREFEVARDGKPYRPS
jgi:hypothetical protein